MFPIRAKLALGATLRTGTRSFLWLIKSREFANFSYPLTSRNREYLAWFVAEITGRQITEILGFFDELENDENLKNYIESRLQGARRRKELDGRIHFGRRLGWYALIRSVRPRVVVETGTEKGLGSLVISRALERNGDGGKLFTIDIEPTSGLLIGPEHDGTVHHLIGDSLEHISSLHDVDLFIHDSDHSAEHERAEFRAVKDRLSRDAICLSDNSHVTSELAQWSRENSRRFVFFKEEPKNHWYPGAGIGVSLNPSTTS